MADISEVGDLLHVHGLLMDHGDMFPNLKANVLRRLREIESEHGTKKNEPVVEESSAPEIEPPVVEGDGRRV